MAIKTAGRWKPDTFRGAAETTVQWSDKAAGDGTIVRVAQLVAYDDTKIGGGNPYVAGDMASEKFIVVLDQTPIAKDLASFAALSGAQSKAQWDAALQAEVTAWTPVAPTLAKAIVSAVMSNPVVMS